MATVEHCEEDRAGHCETHEARWPQTQPHCTAVKPEDFWAAEEVRRG